MTKKSKEEQIQLDLDKHGSQTKFKLLQNFNQNLIPSVRIGCVKDVGGEVCMEARMPFTLTSQWRPSSSSYLMADDGWTSSSLNFAPSSKVEIKELD
jgi:hypothetical protein